MMRLVFRPEAVREIAEARDWYDERHHGLGGDLVSQIENAIERIRQSPLDFACIYGQYRFVVIRRFPYSVIYHANDDELVVISVFHHRRVPGAWRKRTDPRSPEE